MLDGNAAGAQSARLQFKGNNMLLTGDGVLQSSDAAENELSGARRTNRLVHDVDHEIHMAGELGADRLILDNRGTITTVGAVPLVIDPSDGPDRPAPAVVNTGNIQIGDGGTLVLQDGFFRNEAGGTIGFDPASTQVSELVLQDARLVGQGETIATADDSHAIRIRGNSTLQNIALLSTSSPGELTVEQANLINRGAFGAIVQPASFVPRIRIEDSTVDNRGGVIHNLQALEDSTIRGGLLDSEWATLRLIGDVELDDVQLGGVINDSTQATSVTLKNTIDMSESTELNTFSGFGGPNVTLAGDVRLVLGSSGAVEGTIFQGGPGGGTIRLDMTAASFPNDATIDLAFEADNLVLVNDTATSIDPGTEADGYFFDGGNKTQAEAMVSNSSTLVVHDEGGAETVRLRNGLIDNAGGVIDFTTHHLELANVAIRGGDLMQHSSATLQVTDTLFDGVRIDVPTMDLTGATFRNVEITSSTPIVGDTIVVEGALTLAPGVTVGSENVGFDFQEDITLSGNGTLTVSTLTGAAGKTVAIDQGYTLRLGNGNVGSDNLRFVNRGLIEFVDTDTILDSFGGANATEAGLVNRGTMTSAAGGVLIFDTTVDNFGGAMPLEDVDLQDTTIRGGSLGTALPMDLFDAMIRVEGNATLENVTLLGTVQAANPGALLTLRGQIDGDYDLDGSGGLEVRIDGDVTLLDSDLGAAGFSSSLFLATVVSHLAARPADDR